jgi:hypothetical protein
MRRVANIFPRLGRPIILWEDMKDVGAELGADGLAARGGGL